MKGYGDSLVVIKLSHPHPQDLSFPKLRWRCRVRVSLPRGIIGTSRREFCWGSGANKSLLVLELDP